MAHKEHGTYGSQLVVLVYNDGDLYQPKAEDIAGKTPSYPDHHPTSALFAGMKYLTKKGQDQGTGQDVPSEEMGAKETISHSGATGHAHEGVG